METKSSGTVPKRGILLEYWLSGCPTPREPGFGYLNYRNDTHATFSCSLGHVFAANLERTKTIACDAVSGHWSDASADMTSCVSIEFLR